MPAQYDPPLDYDFGLEFDYSTWTEDSEVTLCTVPWDAEYRDVVRFASAEALDAYIDSLPSATTRILSDMSYVKPNRPIAIDLRHNIANRFNYVRVRNPLQPGGPDRVTNFYYFINATDYAAPDTTVLNVQLDLWQTYIYRVQFGNAFIERGHVGIANSKNFDSFGRDYLTIPEGMDIGSDYRVISKRKRQIMGMIYEPPVPPATVGRYVHDMNIVAVATQDLTAPPTKPNPIDPNNPLPNFVTAPGSRFNNITSGAAVYAWQNPESFRLWLQNHKDYPWRVQSLSAIYVLPSLNRYVEESRIVWPASGTPYHVNDLQTWPAKHKLFGAWRDSAEILNNIPERYRHLKKFLTSPYLQIELTTWSATPIVLKPENWATADADVLERPNLVPPGQRVEVIPRRYNADPNFKIENYMGLTDAQVAELYPNNPRPFEIEDDGGEWLDFATRITNFTSVPVVSNAGVAYLASNMSSIHAQQMGNMWSQTRAQAGAQLSYDQATRGMQGQRDQDQINAIGAGRMNDITNQALLNNFNIGTAQGVASGLVGATGDGGFNPLAILGAGINGISNGFRAGAQMQTNTDAMNAQLVTAANTLFNQLGIGEFNRDTNFQLANYAARGDYAQSQLALNARVQDALSVQPTVNGQAGGDSYNLANNTVEFSVRWKMIDRANITMIGEFWLQFGYAVMRSVAKLPEDLMVMTKFSYWKLNKVYLRSGNMPEPHKQGIRGILEKGVTVWRDANDIGFTDFADNQPLPGISL